MGRFDCIYNMYNPCKKGLDGTIKDINWHLVLHMYYSMLFQTFWIKKLSANKKLNIQASFYQVVLTSYFSMIKLLYLIK
jgi:hypothetical protein